MELRLNWLAGLFLSILLGAQSATFASQISSSATALKFKKQKIEFIYKEKRKILWLDAAISMDEHAYGLMNRNKLAQDDGMIFIFQDESIREFWMKDTLIDLDIAYISANKVIIDIQNMKSLAGPIAYRRMPTYPSKGPAQFAVEMNSGWFKKNGFPVGTEMKLLSGPTSKK